VFRSAREGRRIVPVEKGDDKEWRVSSDMTMGAKDGELVEAEAVGGRRLGFRRRRWWRGWAIRRGHGRRA
jgi:ribonuclease R